MNSILKAAALIRSGTANNDDYSTFTTHIDSASRAEARDMLTTNISKLANSNALAALLAPFISRDITLAQEAKVIMTVYRR